MGVNLQFTGIVIAPIDSFRPQILPDLANHTRSRSNKGPQSGEKRSAERKRALPGFCRSPSVISRHPACGISVLRSLAELLLSTPLDRLRS
jgi:hypothetical protein